MATHGHTTRETPAPRPLSAQERAVLTAILTYADFEGRDSLLGELDRIRVVGGCDCGCASIDLRVPGDAEDAPAYPVQNEATVMNDEGHDVGGVLVFAGGGHLRQLEVYSFVPQPIAAIPDVDRLRCVAIER